ncbi:interferon-induced protein 44-like [Sphaeramia orbicularis]|uniref:interferon-induced protein 44-like n=1 Tax=Sphaeramia orbicularis TaxID=375764 RepID=UPI00117FFD06|nr:interferon-induced protein 44-like [Sphaeramia orbicularis]
MASCTMEPRNDERNEDQHIRILLHGPTGHGKSSFINSVDTVLQGEMTGRALADSFGGKSFTKKELMTNVRQEASDMGIPQMAILTKTDEACPEVNEDLRNVYKSQKLREKLLQ